MPQYFNWYAEEKWPQISQAVDEIHNMFTLRKSANFNIGKQQL